MYYPLIAVAVVSRALRQAVRAASSKAVRSEAPLREKAPVCDISPPNAQLTHLLDTPYGYSPDCPLCSRIPQTTQVLDKTPLYEQECPHAVPITNRCGLKRHLVGDSRYCQKDNCPRNSQNSDRVAHEIR